MQILKIQFAPWDRRYDFLNQNNLPVKIGDYVMVETEMGRDIGRVIDISQESKREESDLKNIVKIATTEDLSQLANTQEKDDAISYCRTLVKSHKLAMKIIDVHYSHDRSRMKFAFVADGRVDFRELVKDLTRHFSKSIILYQIGIRDEARMCGDIGRCGSQKLCCGKFLKDIGGVTSDMSETQQVAHRGSERLSGQCGRLMCCLKFEQEGYTELAKKLPAIGTKAKYENSKAEVIGWHTLKTTVDLKVYDANGKYERVFDVELNNIKIVK